MSASPSGSDPFVVRLRSSGIVAVLRTKTAEPVPAIVRALLEGGIDTFEVTFTIPGALGLVEKLSAEWGDRILLGAGTVLDADTARAALGAGARFLVSPVFDREVLAAARVAGAHALPGCFTPTEIREARAAGATVVKLFPAASLGPDFLRDLRGPFPEISVLPTGGITPESAPAWIRAGAVAVGLGSQLIDPALVAASQWDALKERARAARLSVEAARS